MAKSTNKKRKVIVDSTGEAHINASFNNSFEPDTITLEQATELINEKRAKGPTKRKRKKKKK